MASAIGEQKRNQVAQPPTVLGKRTSINTPGDDKAPAEVDVDQHQTKKKAKLAKVDVNGSEDAQKEYDQLWLQIVDKRMKLKALEKKHLRLGYFSYSALHLNWCILRTPYRDRPSNITFHIEGM